jgi:hypothetical protein
MQATFWLTDLGKKQLLVHLVVPIGDIFEAVAVSDVVYDDDTVGIAVVTVSNGPESLLSRRVPLHKIVFTSTNLIFSPF